jgi:hypothetical protein
MKRSLFMIIATAVIFISGVQSSQAGWPLYSVPEFRGRVIDAETKEPIEGAVAVVLYDKQMLIGGPGGPNSYVYHARECLTDNKGEFYIPSYFSVHVISKGDGVRFIFYKPGYMANYGPMHVAPPLMEAYFSADEAGKEGELHVKQGRPASYKGPMGIVELKKAKTNDERRIGVPSTPTDYSSRGLPLLFKAIADDRKKRGLEAR